MSDLSQLLRIYKSISSCVSVSNSYRDRAIGNVKGVLGEGVELVGNEKGWWGLWCRCWSVVIVLVGEQDLSDVASRSCADTQFPPEKTPGYTLSEIGV